VYRLIVRITTTTPGGMRDNDITAINYLSFVRICWHVIAASIKCESLLIPWYVRVEKYRKPELIDAGTRIVIIHNVDYKLLAACIFHFTVLWPSIGTLATE